MIGLRSSVPILVALCASVLACSPSTTAGPVSTLPATASDGEATVAPTVPVVAPGGSPSSSPAIAPGASSTPLPSPTAKEVTVPFSLTSSAFTDGGAIPKRYTCDGADVSPALDWAGSPDGTVSLALIVDDPDARGFVHWVAFDLTGAATGGLPEGFSSSPDAPPQGTNGFGRVGYGGPCPPSGTHHYIFTLYALDRMLGLAGAPKADAVRAAMAGHVLDEAKLTGTYRR